MLRFPLRLDRKLQPVVLRGGFNHRPGGDHLLPSTKNRALAACTGSRETATRRRSEGFWERDYEQHGWTPHWYEKHICMTCYRSHPKDGEGIVFTGVCPSTPTGGGGSHLADGGYPLPRSGQGGTPFPGLDRGSPYHRSGWGCTPSLVWTASIPSQVWRRWGRLGYPPSRSGPRSGQGGFPRVFPCWDWMGYPPCPGLMGCLDGVLPHPIRRQSSIESTCDAADSMPLEFTREDSNWSSEILVM